MITVGQVVAPQGIAGEVRVRPETDFPERFLQRDRLYLSGPEPRWVRVESVRFHRGMVLVKTALCDDRNAAEGLRGYLVQVPRDQVPALPEGRYYHFELVGMAVTTVDGRPLGRITEILSTGANDVFVVEKEDGKGQHLIPALRSVVVSVDKADRSMVVAPPPGLLE